MDIPILKKYLDKAFSQGLITKQNQIDELWKSIINKTMERKLILKKNRKLPMIESENVYEKFFLVFMLGV